MQEKIGNIFAPLSQIWDFLVGQKNAAHEQISQIEGDILKGVREMFTTWTTELLPHHGHVHHHDRAGI